MMEIRIWYRLYAFVVGKTVDDYGCMVELNTYYATVVIPQRSEE
jgi:hypothetical protein